jgi:hypothetical protein
MAAFTLWLGWPRESDPLELSTADEKLRFVATKYPKMQMLPDLSLRQRLMWQCQQLVRHDRTPNPAAQSFPPVPVQLWGIRALLNNCMQVTGTRYLIGLDIAGGAVEFGSTNTLNGAQWVAAAEHAIEKSDSVMCWDYAAKRSFQDSPLLIREGPGIIKVAPRSRLAEYQRAGLVKAGAR